MTTNLTLPMSKKLLLSIMIITFGAEAVLYLTRFSTLASSLYDGIMVASLFIGWRIAPRLSEPHRKTKRQLWLQLTAAFLIFYLGSTIINIYSSYAFPDFNDDYDQYVQDYTDSKASPGNVAVKEDSSWSIVDEIDSVGYDLYTDSLAGLEEVWRLSYMILVLMVLKKIFRCRWENGSRDIFIMVALFLSSVIFGIDHTLDVEQAWSVKIGSIVTFANMGLLLGIILLWTRNLWVTVIVHSVYDISATISWYYFQYSLEVMALAALIIFTILLVIEMKKKKLHPPLDSAQMAE